MSETDDLLAGIDERIDDTVCGRVVPFVAKADEGVLASQKAAIRAYAKHIANEAHLKAILADIPDPTLRAAVRKMIVPMLSFEVADAE